MTESCLKEDLRTKMKESPILVVGAGGIGCELLKNLVMTGFHNIEVVDLDTIEVSNLNRQFLFQKKHVGMSKAKVARESVLRFNPNAKITAHHGSIIDPNFNVEYFKKFKIVLNALDNIQARMHVNRMCLASGVPLIESGSAGYSGQVELIIKGLSKCYECEVKREPKTYATCTIRNTPSLPIHCIVWAKFLFNQLFGEADADEDVSPDTVTDPELINSGNEYKAQTKSTRVWAQENNYDPRLTFTKLFTDDVNYLLTLTDLWENRRTKPVPIVWGQVKEVPQTEQQTGQIKDQIIWSLKKCVAEFCDSLTKLKEAYQKLEPGNFLVWDKDEDDHMNFVVATANLRASVFGIPLKSKFDIKSMAGNIIPAIATSNAVIAGMVTHYAMNVIEGRYKDCPSVYLREKLNARNASIVPESLLIPPNPECRVCGKSPQVTLVTDVEKLTIKSLENDVLKKTLNMPAPDVSLDQRIIISSEPGETEENLDKTLKEMNIVDGSTLFADDFIQTYEVKIFINHRVMEVGEPDFFVVGDLKELAKEVEQIANLKETKNGETAKKRKQEMTQVPAKKRKTDSAVADDDSDIEMFDDNQESDDDVTIVA